MEEAAVAPFLLQGPHLAKKMMLLSLDGHQQIRRERRENWVWQQADLVSRGRRIRSGVHPWLHSDCKDSLNYLRQYLYIISKKKKPKHIYKSSEIPDNCRMGNTEGSWAFRCS